MRQWSLHFFSSSNYPFCLSHVLMNIYLIIVSFGLNFQKSSTNLQVGFWYHHAEPNYLMLVYWIPESVHTLPVNASHRVGVGGFVMNDKREVLLYDYSWPSRLFHLPWLNWVLNAISKEKEKKRRVLNHHMEPPPQHSPPPLLSFPFPF